MSATSCGALLVRGDVATAGWYAVRPTPPAAARRLLLLRSSTTDDQPAHHFPKRRRAKDSAPPDGAVSPPVSSTTLPGNSVWLKISFRPMTVRFSLG